jgi:hypothetical protein
MTRIIPLASRILPAAVAFALAVAILLHLSAIAARMIGGS